jgi:hypothetical protein
MKASYLLGVAAMVIGPAAYSQTTAPVQVNTGQSLVGAAIGNGVTQGARVVEVNSRSQPAVGVGALSPENHFGSAASVSALNSSRLLGVDGPGGKNATTSISVRNPKQAPVLSRTRQ